MKASGRTPNLHRHTRPNTVQAKRASSPTTRRRRKAARNGNRPLRTVRSDTKSRPSLPYSTKETSHQYRLHASPKLRAKTARSETAVAKKLRAARKEAQRERIEEKRRRRKTKGGGQPEAERRPPATQNTDLDLGFFFFFLGS